MNKLSVNVLLQLTQPCDRSKIPICVFSQALYDGKWHQLKLLVKPRQATGFLDDQLIREVMLEPVVPIYINGKSQLAKRKGTDITVPVSNNATTERSRQNKRSSLLCFGTK